MYVHHRLVLRGEYSRSDFFDYYLLPKTSLSENDRSSEWARFNKF